MAAALPPRLADLDDRIFAETGERPSGYALTAGIDPALFLALIDKESSGRPDAISPAGAVGLTQLMPDTAKALGVDARNVSDNLWGGATYLREQLAAFGNTIDALRAYNQGPGRAQSDGGAGMEYATDVLARAEGQAPEGNNTVAGGFVRDAVDAIKGYGASGLAWVVVGLLVLFGLYALVMQREGAPLAAMNL